MCVYRRLCVFFNGYICVYICVGICLGTQVVYLNNGGIVGYIRQTLPS